MKLSPWIGPNVWNRKFSEYVLLTSTLAARDGCALARLPSSLYGTAAGVAARFRNFVDCSGGWEASFILKRNLARRTGRRDSLADLQLLVLGQTATVVHDEVLKAGLAGQEGYEGVDRSLLTIEPFAVRDLKLLRVDILLLATAQVDKQQGIETGRVGEALKEGRSLLCVGRRIPHCQVLEALTRLTNLANQAQPMSSRLFWHSIVPLIHELCCFASGRILGQLQDLLLVYLVVVPAAFNLEPLQTSLL